MEDLKKVVAKNIQDLRRSADMTQLTLAETLNYSDKAVSKWERGDSLPDVTVLKSIADLFGVTVDYLLTEDHTSVLNKRREYTHRQKVNRLIITALSTMLVWLIGTIVFISINLAGLKMGWLAFLYTLIISIVVILVFNSIWGNRRKNFLIISLLVWGVLAAVYFTVLSSISYNIWLVFIIGIPAQIIILLWSRLR